jgi:hypothetical protein
MQEGTCFSSGDTTGITLNGSFSANVRSFGLAPTNSIGILTSGPFVADSAIKFRALSENHDAIPEPNPVTFEVALLDTSGTVLFSQPITTNIVTLLGIGCPNTVRDGAFSAHTIDTSAFKGQNVRLQFRQHTNVGGFGFFTLVDDVEVTVTQTAAGAGLVPCGGTGQPACNLCHAFELGNRIITFILVPSSFNGGFAFVFLLGGLLLVVAGFFILVGSLGNPPLLSRGKTILFTTLIGLLIIYGSWVGVSFALDLFGVSDFTGTGTWWAIQCG